MKYIFLILITLFPSFAYAEEKPVLKKTPTEIVKTTDVKKVVKPMKRPVLGDDVCYFLSTYSKSNSADYVGGVDVYGKPVVSAIWMKQEPMELPMDFSFDVSVNLATYAGIDIPEGVKMDANFGTVTFKNNKLYFNDKPLTSDQEQGFTDLCAENSKKSETLTPEKPKTN